jgi:hypothetical protein
MSGEFRERPGDVRRIRSLSCRQDKSGSLSGSRVASSHALHKWVPAVDISLTNQDTSSANHGHDPQTWEGRIPMLDLTFTVVCVSLDSKPIIRLFLSGQPCVIGHHILPAYLNTIVFRYSGARVVVRGCDVRLVRIDAEVHAMRMQAMPNLSASSSWRLEHWC